MFVSVCKVVSCEQQIVGSSFLIQFPNQWLLIGELNPLTFSVNFERYVVILAIYLFLLCRSWCACATNSMLLTDYLSRPLLRFNNSHAFMAMFVFIFSV
jgi:hypothetical protein